MPDDLFGNNTTPVIDPDKDYFVELVGEDKKYKSTKDAGRALVEKDLFIEKLKRDAEEARSMAQQAIKMEEFMDRLNTFQPNTPPQETPPAPEGTGLKLEDVEKLLEQKVLEREATASKQRNLREVQDALKSKFGEAASTVVDDKANQLGVGKSFLQSLAETQPKAFLALVGVDTKAPVQSQTPPRSGVNTSGFQPSADEKTQSYYEKMLREDRSKYLSREIQLEMHKQAVKLGLDFFK